MDLYEFTKLAVRTESPLDAFSAPSMLLTNALTVYIAAGNILDQIKKNTFYGSNFDLPKYKQTIHQLCDKISESAESLQLCPSRFLDPNELVKTSYDVNVRAAHSLIGCLTESSELAEAFLHYLNTGELDIVNVTEEMVGDHGWYMAIFMDEYQIDPYQPLINVINKLKARYPDKFTQEAAETRNLDAERVILSTNIS